MNFKNKIALVTGASRGIGESISKILVSYGAFVVGTATSYINIKKIENNLGKYGQGMLLDCSNNISINNFLNLLNKKYKQGIDILINNSGVKCDNFITKINNYDWTYVMNVNLTSIFYLSKFVIKNMIKKKYGRIINIGSVIGSTGNIGQTNYAASKSGLIGFSKSLALEVASMGITVNVVSPGFIETDMTNNLIKKNRSNIESKIPVNRIGMPEDIAHIVVFLASNKSSYITGETIHVNGGFYMS
ncbi:MAG: 3-oxoacyl-ACP reductase family protein [Enterobacterales bacterium]